MFGTLQADYRQDGNQLLICCSVDGEVRGFAAGGDLQGNLMDVNVDQETLRELSQKKQVWTMDSFLWFQCNAIQVRFRTSRALNSLLLTYLLTIPILSYFCVSLVLWLAVQ